MKLLIFSFFSIMILQAAPQNQKLLMIVVKKEHCGWCKKLDNEIFADKEAEKLLKKHYYIAKITKESGNLPLFVHDKYYPTTFIYSLDGKTLIDSLVGYRTKEKFLKFFRDGYENNDDF